MRSTAALNIALAVVVLAGAGWAYLLVSDSSSTTVAGPTGSRPAQVTQGAVVATVSASGTVQSGTTASADFVTAGTVASIAVHAGPHRRDRGRGRHLHPGHLRADRR